MCPSYRVTGEERHSTRGRSRLLFEMLQGEVLPRGWRSSEVKEALDLCLACKACKRDCPAGVDMAAYKAEFLAHYWRRRVRPPAAYTLGLVHDWARLASRAPPVANRLARSSWVAGLVKLLGGIDARRSLPPLAPRTFRRWFRARPPRDGRRPRVLLFPDTFTNYFQPEVAQAAVEVLEAVGVGVEIPPRDLCCGRPLYDFGFLGRARRLLRQVLEALDGSDEGAPVLVLEPSCAAVFRDELPNLLPGEAAARLAARTVTLAELFDRQGIEPPGVSGRALLHPHCHQRAVLGTDADGRILARAGVTARVLDAGCCGMAGAFGFQKGKVELSLAVGELALFPALREVGQETLVLADGFSCRQQIAQATGARPLHLAELLRRGVGETPPP
jgi:Fe-S oxidoreductase